MLDTTNEMLQKQREIIFSKSSNERFMIGVDAISFGRTMVESSIKQKNPHITKLDLKIAIMKRYYENIMNPIEFNKMIKSLENFYLNGQKTGS